MRVRPIIPPCGYGHFWNTPRGTARGTDLCYLMTFFNLTWFNLKTNLIENDVISNQIQSNEVIFLVPSGLRSMYL